MVKRIPDALLAPEPLISSTPYLDLGYGGSMGWAPVPEEFNSETLYISQHLIPIVLNIPRAFANTPQGQTFGSMFKAAFERHPTKITGLKSDLTMEYADTPYGGSGQKIYAATNATIAESTPSFTFVEKYGRPIQRLLSYWIRYHLLDPETKTPLSVTYSDPNTRPSDYLLDQMSMTMLFIEPDPTFRFVQRSYLCLGMMPTTSGPEESKRDKSSAMDKLEYDIEFKCTTQIGVGVNALASKVLSLLDLRNANPLIQKAGMDEIAPDVAALGNGFIEQAKNMGDNAITSI